MLEVKGLEAAYGDIKVLWGIDIETKERQIAEERPPIIIRTTLLRPLKKKSLIGPQVSLPTTPPKWARERKYPAVITEKSSLSLQNRMR